MAFFRQIYDRIAKDYPSVRPDHAYIDAFALYLLQKPQTYDVIVTENMYGDILSDLAAGLVGGMGMAPLQTLENIQLFFNLSWHGSGHCRAEYCQPNRYDFVREANVTLVSRPEKRSGLYKTSSRL